ncbi:MAG TPA: phage baseplate protein, partial [Thermoanaerobaculia bacterium]|nr:phage baseplate protein [Thermoanaerobaculia bacterium]
MRPLSAPELLEAWERGLAGHPVQRALLLVAAACPGTPPEELARESVGRRDGRLLTLREWTF